MFFEKAPHLGLVIFARLPDHLERRPELLSREPRLHRLVERAAAQRAAHDEHRGACGVQSESGRSFQPVGLGRHGEASAQGISRVHDPLGGEEALHAVVGHADTPRTACEDLVRQTGVGVLLLDERRDSRSLRGPQHGPRGVAAESHHDVGAELADRAPRTADAFEYLEGQRQIRQREPPLQSRRRQPYDAVAQRRNLLHLHFAFGADEEQFHPVAAAALKCFGHRDGRIDVAACAAARKNDAFYHIVFVSQDSIFSFHPASTAGLRTVRGFCPSAPAKVRIPRLRHYCHRRKRAVLRWG